MLKECNFYDGKFKFGSRLQQLRLSEGFSYDDLARRFGDYDCCVHEEEIASWESCDYIEFLVNIDGFVLVCLADIFRVSLDCLMGFEDIETGKANYSARKVR